jgi:hypothetical protein
VRVGAQRFQEAYHQHLNPGDESFEPDPPEIEQEFRVEIRESRQTK